MILTGSQKRRDLALADRRGKGLLPRSCFALPVAAFALLAGCAVGPDYALPEATTVPATYANASSGWKVARPQAQIPQGNWWELFADPRLNALETQASAQDQQLKAAAERFAEARAAMDFTRAGFFPTLALAGLYTRQRTSADSPLATTGLPYGQSTTYNDYELPLDASYEFDLWGRVRRSVESAQAQMRASADDLQAVKLVIQAEVAVDYFSLQALDAEEAVVRSSIKVFTTSRDLTQNRRIGGIATDLDVAQAQTLLKTTEAQVPAIALQRAQFEHALALLAGQPASVFRLPVCPLASEPPLIPAGLPSELLERRPDISAAERRMAAANANIGVAKAAFFPSFQLMGLAGLESINSGNLLSKPSALWAAGPSLSLPLFEGGRLKAGLTYAKASYQEVVAEYRQVVLSAFSEVEDNLAAQSLVASQYQTEGEALVAARKQLELANNRYRDGLVTYLEVATAESAELGIEFSTVRLHGERLIAAVNLVKSLGGGWPEPTEGWRRSPPGHDLGQNRL
jgi:multidrug efflux system outer membrane protein